MFTKLHVENFLSLKNVDIELGKVNVFIGTFMNLVRDSPSQVVITTHSLYLLDHVKPEEVQVIWKEGLETKVKKLSATKEMENVKRFLEEGGTLGEAWYSGIFGGTP